MLPLIIKTKELVIKIHPFADWPLLSWKGLCSSSVAWIVLFWVQSSWRKSFWENPRKSRKVWHNVKQEYNYLNVNGELSGNKLWKLEEQKLITCDSRTVEAKGKFDVMLCSVQMCKVQIQALFIGGWGKEINFTCLSLKMFLLFFLLTSMSWDQVWLQWMASWLARWNRRIKQLS